MKFLQLYIEKEVKAQTQESHCETEMWNSVSQNDMENKAYEQVCEPYS